MRTTCLLAGVSRAGFYRSLQGRTPVEEEMAARSAIPEIAVEHRRRYGYRRITAELRRRGMLVNHERVLRILRADIDCMKTGNARIDPDEWARTQMSKGPNDEVDPLDRLGVTLSGLLNVLDGFHAPENVLFVMTTNKIETLDQALLRPGRIDYRLFLGKAADEQKIELYRRFFPRAAMSEAREFVETHHSSETMAEFQGVLLGFEQGRPSDPTDCVFQDA